MKVRALVLVLWILVIPIGVHAETLLLKNGTVVKAKILEQDKKKMKVEVNGQTVTYYMDEIQSVNNSSVMDSVAFSSTADAVPTPDVQQVAKPTELQTAKLPYSPSFISKRVLIKKFIDVFGTRENMTQNFERMLASMPPQKREEVRKILNVDEVIDNLVPLYDKYFTQEELESYLEFYSSDEGQKFLKTIPQIMKESVDVNIEYFKTKLPKNAQ